MTFSEGLTWRHEIAKINRIIPVFADYATAYKPNKLTEQTNLANLPTKLTEQTNLTN